VLSGISESDANEQTAAMSRALYGLIGAGGFGREVMPLLRQQLAPMLAQGEADLVFVVESSLLETGGTPPVVNGTRVIDIEAFIAYPGDRFFNIAIADSAVRERLAVYCLDRGARPITIRAANVVCLDENEIGAGAIFCPFAMVTSNSRIGRFFHANYYAYVTHDCVIGDFVTFAPQASCNGNVRIEDHAYIGAGALIRQGSRAKPLIIGRGAVVGMGAVVIQDVAPGVTVVGNPARPLIKGR
jgi:sugar O-acyltransferase (sialic acid O-acetyltransferase NeuD family)